MQKKGLWAFALVLSILLLAGVYYLFLPVVIFVEAPLPEEYLSRLSKPSYFSLSYRLVISSEDELAKNYVKFKPDLVLFSPLTENPGYIDAKTAGWGFPENTGFDLLIHNDHEKMFSTALEAAGDVSTAFVYPRGSAEALELLESLEEDDEFVYGLEYSERISDANKGTLLDDLRKNETVNVLLFSPDSAYALLTEETGIKFYADYRDVAALYSPKNLVSIGPDWNSAIKKALSEDSDFSFDYTLASSKNLVEVLEDIFL